MNRIKFYMAGGMGGLPIEEQLEWRKYIENRITECDEHKGTYFFQPPYYYQPDGNTHKSEREAMEFDLNRLKHSDVVIVNFNVPSSIGTAIELAIAYEHRIPVIGLNEDSKDIHPWLKECCTRICDTRDELVNHILDFYMT